MRSTAVSESKAPSVGAGRTTNGVLVRLGTALRALESLSDRVLNVGVAEFIDPGSRPPPKFWIFDESSYTRPPEFWTLDESSDRRRSGK